MSENMNVFYDDSWAAEPWRSSEFPPEETRRERSRRFKQNQDGMTPGETGFHDSSSFSLLNLEVGRGGMLFIARALWLLVIKTGRLRLRSLIGTDTLKSIGLSTSSRDSFGVSLISTNLFTRAIEMWLFRIRT